MDKRIVKEEGSEKEVWWGPVNKPMTPDVCSPALTHDSGGGEAIEGAMSLALRPGFMCPFPLSYRCTRAKSATTRAPLTSITCFLTCSDFVLDRHGKSIENVLSIISILATAYTLWMAMQDGTSGIGSMSESSVLVPIMLSSCGICSLDHREKSLNISSRTIQSTMPDHFQQTVSPPV